MYYNSSRRVREPSCSLDLPPTEYICCTMKHKTGQRRPRTIELLETEAFRGIPLSMVTATGLIHTFKDFAVTVVNSVLSQLLLETHQCHQFQVELIYLYQSFFFFFKRSIVNKILVHATLLFLVPSHSITTFLALGLYMPQA